LSATAGVTALVSNRIYPVTATQNATLPYITYSIVSVNPTDTKDRPSHLDAVRLQVDCWAATYMAAEAIHGAVRDAIDAYTIGETVAGVVLDGIKYETENDTLDEDVDIFRKSADYMIRVKYS
jgi:hypothetical protein